MKQITIFALVAVLVLSLTACGRKKDDMVKDPTTVPTTQQPVTTNPTTATNIPDDKVNDNSTDNGMDPTNEGTTDMMPDGVTGNTDATE